MDRVPDPPGATVSDLGGVTCVAVGDTAASFGSPGAGLVESSSRGSWAVGSPRQPARATGSGLRAVSCPATTECIAVGTLSATHGPGISFAERWNGARWSLERTALPAGGRGAALFDVSCSGADACTAVGGYTDRSGHQRALAERWNGASWIAQAVPGPARRVFERLYGVSCAGPACVAVGYTSGTGNASAYAVSSDGAGWHLDAVPEPAGETHSELFAVSCADAGHCTAVGSYGTNTRELLLAESWDGAHWRLQRVSEPAGAVEGELAAVSCPSKGTCEAVGYDSTSGLGAPTALAARWAGAHRRLQAMATTAGTVASTLLGVACIGPWRCTAVGYSQTASGEVLPMADGDA